MQGTCVFGTGCMGARLLVWLVLNDRVQPSFIAGVCISHSVSAHTHALLPVRYDTPWIFAVFLLAGEGGIWVYASQGGCHTLLCRGGGGGQRACMPVRICAHPSLSDGPLMRWQTDISQFYPDISQF